MAFGASEYGFHERMLFSDGHAPDVEKMLDSLKGLVPGCVGITKATKSEDRSGVDYWCEMSNGDRLGVDVKVRARDPIQAFGKDDLAIETYSVIESDIPGWSRDERKRTHYILWYFKDSGRFCLVPFVLLCKATQLKWREWKRLYKVDKQHTPSFISWHSECVFVPRRVVWRAIYEVAHGQAD